MRDGREQAARMAGRSEPGGVGRGRAARDEGKRPGRRRVAHSAGSGAGGSVSPDERPWHNSIILFIIVS